LRDGFEGTKIFSCLLRETDHKCGMPKSPVIPGLIPKTPRLDQVMSTSTVPTTAGYAFGSGLCPVGGLWMPLSGVWTGSVANGLLAPRFCGAPMRMSPPLGCCAGISVGPNSYS